MIVENERAVEVVSEIDIVADFMPYINALITKTNVADQVNSVAGFGIGFGLGFALGVAIYARTKRANNETFDKKDAVGAGIGIGVLFGMIGSATSGVVSG